MRSIQQCRLMNNMSGMLPCTYYIIFVAFLNTTAYHLMVKRDNEYANHTTVQVDEQHVWNVAMHILHNFCCFLNTTAYHLRFSKSNGERGRWFAHNFASTATPEANDLLEARLQGAWLRLSGRSFAGFTPGLLTLEDSPEASLGSSVASGWAGAPWSEVTPLAVYITKTVSGFLYGSSLICVVMIRTKNLSFVSQHSKLLK